MKRLSGARLGAPGFTSAAIGNYAAVGGQAIRTLVLARLLQPHLFGTLNVTNIASNLTVFSDLGTGTYGEKVAADARGRGDLQESAALLIRSARARMVTAWALAVGLGAGGVGSFLTGRDDAGVICTFLAVSVVLQTVWTATRGWLQVHGDMRGIMRCQVTQVVIWLTLVPLCAWWWGLTGALYSMAASYLGPLAMAAPTTPLLRFLRPDPRAFREWLGGGLSLWAIRIANFVYVNCDHFLIALFIGPTGVGYYAIATLGASALAAFSDGAALAGHVRTLEAVARHGHLSVRIPSVGRLMHTVRAGFGVLVPLEWIGIGLVAWVFLPDYQPSLAAVAALGAATAVTGTVNASNAALLSVGLHRYMPALFGGAAAVKAVVFLAVLPVSRSIEAMAVAALLGAVVVGVGTVGLLSRAFTRPRRPMVGLVREFLATPLLLCVAALAVMVVASQAGVGPFLLASTVVLAVGGAISAVSYRRHLSAAEVEGILND